MEPKKKMQRGLHHLDFLLPVKVSFSVNRPFTANAMNYEQINAWVCFVTLCLINVIMMFNFLLLFHHFYAVGL